MSNGSTVIWIQCVDLQQKRYFEMHWIFFHSTKCIFFVKSFVAKATPEFLLVTSSLAWIESGGAFLSLDSCVHGQSQANHGFILGRLHHKKREKKKKDQKTNKNRKTLKKNKGKITAHATTTTKKKKRPKSKKQNKNNPKYIYSLHRKWKQRNTQKLNK